MSMRVGDESGRARAAALDPGLVYPEPVVTPDDRGEWRAAWRRFRHHRAGAASGSAFLVFMVLACFVGAHFAPDPDFQDLLKPTSGPSTAHWFGTDELSRDTLSRVLHGGQISLTVAFGVALLSTAIGVVIGALAGFYRGWLDGLLMRFTDLWLALPALPFLAVAVSIGTVDLGPLGTLDLGGPLGITLLLSCLLWGSIARVVRGATLALREREFVDAARAIGASNTRIITRHVLPNCLGPIIVNATLVVAEAILVESTLSFLGFGIQPPTPSWGNLLSDSIGTVQDWWWLTVFPGPRHLPHRAGDQLRRRRPARRVRPPPAVARVSGHHERRRALAVEDLRVQFAGDGRVVQAVRGVSFTRRRGRDGRGRRRVGLGQDGDRAGGDGPHRPARDDHRRRRPARRPVAGRARPSASTVSCAGASWRWCSRTR